MVRLYCALIGYAFGMLQTAYILGKIKGIDIRQHGSGNAGTTNTMRVLGTKAGLLVLLCDILKCIVAVIVTQLIFYHTGDGNLYLLKIYTAAGCILGHNFPFYLKFKGGKGIAATAGMILSFQWYMIPIEILIFFGIFLTTHYVSLGSLAVYLAFVAMLIIFGQNGVYGMDQCLLNEMYLVGVFLMLLAFFMHRKNIGRLVHGCESKTFLSKKKKAEYAALKEQKEQESK